MNDTADSVLYTPGIAEGNEKSITRLVAAGGITVTLTRSFSLVTFCKSIVTSQVLKRMSVWEQTWNGAKANSNTSRRLVVCLFMDTQK
jgi:hypothetical protein